MTSNQIRQTFLDFFKSKGHTIVPSAPMVLKNDPTLMFTNAGMNPFKDIFLGNAPAEYARVADTQKCLRVSGKHNDLEEVGHDTYHHTMFEMLGNWSFGDYFKEEAIAWAWELLTEVYKLDKDRIYVTVFEGDASENLDFDQEAYDFWKRHIAEDRILKGNKKDNFWEMGDQGPCGPCSEIHIDLRTDEERARVDGKTLVNNDHPQVIEIWNNVFMQFNRSADGKLSPLPAKHVDTGMGFERLVRAIEGKHSNYDTDVFRPYIGETEKLSGIKYGETEKTDVAFRVVADHVRAVAFAIADGQMPSHTGAGYVIRRILRRAIRYGYSYLNFREPFMWKLVSVMAENMGSTFPELIQQKDFIEKVIREEENGFLRTLEKGLTRLAFLMEKAENKQIGGAEVFELYDTFGFPVDLTRLIAAENGISIDEEGFTKCLSEQKERSRKATQIKAGDWVEIRPYSQPQFVGYDQLECEAHILRYRKVNAKGKDLFHIVLDKTPFYAESGGQVGDSGVLESANERLKVTDTQKENELIIHICEQVPENPEAVFTAKPDAHNRILTANNHSATHLLHAALRSVLGTHVEQRGSLVNPEGLRFDFSHHSKLSAEEILEIEQLVNRKIRENIQKGERRNVPIEEAKKLGAMALFGEKYGDEVRVISFGLDYSVELCGGIHVNYTGQIGYFKIISEASVAAGIRRIEAVTAVGAENHVLSELNLLQELKSVLKSTGNPIKQAENLQKEISELRKTVESYKAKEASAAVKDLLTKTHEVNGVRLLTAKVNLDADAMKNVCFEWKRDQQNLVAVLGNSVEGKALLSVFVSDDLITSKGLNAVNITREIAKEIQGGGGGQPFFATAGGKNPDGLEAAFAKVSDLL
ncbi:MAG: alanine--tRNA ligase [Flavobacteriales bacterium]|nr:alanine--tRNA ligase [Flavobacteriales bacterium]